jgi:hypothetical protein
VLTTLESGRTSYTKREQPPASSFQKADSRWTPSHLTLDDFAPDKDSPSGYIARVQTHLIVTEPHFVEGSFVLDTFRASGNPEGREIAYAFSAEVRSRWYLRDEQDGIAENLWDVFVDRATSAKQSGVIEIIPSEARFVVLEGVRLGVRRVAFEVEIRRHERTIEVDLLKRAIAYENALTGKVTIVPLPQVGQLKVLAGRPKTRSSGV